MVPFRAEAGILSQVDSGGGYKCSNVQDNGRIYNGMGEVRIYRSSPEYIRALFLYRDLCLSRILSLCRWMARELPCNKQENVLVIEVPCSMEVCFPGDGMMIVFQHDDDDDDHNDNHLE